jgi:hypothetical protein
MKSPALVVIILIIVIGTAALIWMWNFGVVTTWSNNLPAPANISQGIFQSSTYTINVSANENLTKPSNINSVVQHPVTWKIQNTPGYLQPDVEPYKSDLHNIMIKANSTKDPSTFYTALAYQITGNTDYANKSIEYLLKYATPNASSSSVGSYAQAYDLIYQTKNVNSTLNDTVDATIRHNIAVLADKSYKITRDHQPSTLQACAPDDYYLGGEGGYFNIAIAGLVLADYNGELPYGTTPAMWEAVGEDGLFTNDPVGTYISRNGMLWCTNDATGNKKGFLDYGYTGYYDTKMFTWFNIYQNAKGHSIFQDYPGWEGVVMGDVWSNLPNRYSDNTHAASIMYRTNVRYMFATLDQTNRSALMWHYNLMNANRLAGLYPWASNPTSDSVGNRYLMEYNFSNETASPPAKLNTLDGIFNFIRSDWSDRAEWLEFVVWNYPNGMGQGRTSEIDANQLAITYYSHGDLLVAPQSDVKYINGGSISYYNEILENDFMFGRYFAEPYNYPREWLIRNTSNHHGLGFNMTLRSMYKATASHDITPALSNLAIDNNFMTAKSGNVTITIYHEVYDSRQANITLASPISYSRTILFPKDYMTIVDRAKSAITYDYATGWMLTSLGINRSQNSPLPAGKIPYIEPDETGNVNGTMKIEGNYYDWYNNYDAGVESEPVQGNTVTWDTTNLYGNNVNLTIFSVPRTNISFQKQGIRLGTSQDERQNVYAPRVYFIQPENETLYSITVLLTKYANESARTPSEIPVVGIGSALRVNTSSGSQKDYIYTGTGTSSFDTFQTDADTAFIRKTDKAHITDYTLINCTFFKDIDAFKFVSSTRLSAISFNSSSGKSYANIFGNGGTTDLYFYNVSPAPTYVKRDGVDWSGNWGMTDATTLHITSPLNDHYFEFDSG